VSEGMSPRKVVRLYYGFQFFFSMLLWLPVFYEFQKRVGLDDAQIFGIQSLYYLSFCLLEIPTGLIADWFGHRRCLQWGAIICALTNAIPIFFPTYSGFIVHWLLVALARSLVSGASSAYLYRYLQQNGALELYKPAEGNARAYGLVGKLFGYAAVSPLMAWDLNAPYWMTTILTAAAIPYAYALPKGKPYLLVEQVQQASSVASRRLSRFGNDITAVCQALLKSPVLIWVMIQGISIFVLTRICQVNLFQPLLILKGVGLSSHGLVLSAMTAFEAAGSALPATRFYRERIRTTRWGSDLHLVSILTVCLAVSMGAMAIFGGWGTIAALCIFSIATGFAFPVQRQLVNDVITADQFRATFLSVESILDRAVVAWVAACLGGFVSRGQIPFFLELSALASVVVIVCLTLKFASAGVKQAKLS
jgi:MFS family permease